MKFKSTLLAQASGSLAGATFSRNKGGSYVRSRVIPLNPNTPDQVTQRGHLSALATGWRNLTDEQRATWIRNAPQFPYVDVLGDSRVLSGFQLYLKLNLNLITAGQATIDTCPIPGSFDDNPIVSVVADSSSGSMAITMTTAVSLDYVYIVKATPQVSVGINRPSKSSFRVVTTQIGSDVIDVTDGYAAKYGTLVLGQAIFCNVEVMNVNTGQKISLGNIKGIVT